MSLNGHANGFLLNRSVLVLNTNYMPLTICTAKRAICLFFLDKVEVLVSYREKVHSPTIALSLPSIVKLRDFVHYNSMEVALSRRNVLLRDNHQCQYCSTRSGPFTIDHVLPRERAGSEQWDNLVTACQPCNRKKGNHTPEEAGMPLTRHPRKPNRIHYFQQFIREPQASWRPYLFLESF